MSPTRRPPPVDKKPRPPKLKADDLEVEPPILGTPAFKQVHALKADRLRVGSPPRPPTGKGALGLAIEWAIATLWPTGIPERLRARDRNNAIHGLLKGQRYTQARDVDKAFERAVERVLKKMREPQ